jgi:hypothetical protein
VDFLSPIHMTWMDIYIQIHPEELENATIQQDISMDWMDGRIRYTDKQGRSSGGSHYTLQLGTSVTINPLTSALSTHVFVAITDRGATGAVDIHFI